MRNLKAGATGALVGTLGGLIGLGGAEFRLPLLVGIFQFRMLPAIVVNLAVSLATVVFSFFFRTRLIPFDQISSHGFITLNILAGSLVGSYAGVRLSIRASERVLCVTVVGLLLTLSVLLMAYDWLFSNDPLVIPGVGQVTMGLLAGIIIGIVSSMLGVAGGELIIPTIVLLYGVNIKVSWQLKSCHQYSDDFDGSLAASSERELSHSGK